jgi:8-oxo-dGTP diphosphatase
VSENSNRISEWPVPRLRVALITLDGESRFFLLQHSRPHGKYWVLPGGGVEYGEKLESALEREIQEELGVSCLIEKLRGVGELITPLRHVVDFYFSGKLDVSKEFRIKYEEGISDTGWFGLETIGTMDVLPREIMALLETMAARKEQGVMYLGKYKIR